MGFRPMEQAILLAGNAVKEKLDHAIRDFQSCFGFECVLKATKLEMEDGTCVFQDHADGGTKGR